MRDYLLEEVKLQRIDFILKKVAFGTCDFEEKKWLSSGWLNYQVNLWPKSDA